MCEVLRRRRQLLFTSICPIIMCILSNELFIENTDRAIIALCPRVSNVVSLPVCPFSGDPVALSGVPRRALPLRTVLDIADSSRLLRCGDIMAPQRELRLLRAERVCLAFVLAHVWGRPENMTPQSTFDDECY